MGKQKKKPDGPDQRGAVPEPPRHAFERRPKCPECGRQATRATSTRDGVQLRKCFLPSCGATFKVPAVEIG